MVCMTDWLDGGNTDVGCILLPWSMEGSVKINILAVEKTDHQYKMMHTAA